MKRVARFIGRWKFVWKATTVALMLTAVALVIFVWPGVSNLWVSIFVLVSGLSSALADMADEIEERWG